jgi:capsular exopolysaccharide synthesis family protein
MTDPVQSTALSTVSAQHSVSAAPPNPVLLVADRLQNRWIPCIVVGVALAVLLGAAGYLFAPVKYASTGLLSVEYSLDAIIDDTPETAELDNYDAYVLQQAALVADPRVLEAVVTRARGGTISERAARIGEAQARREQEVLRRVFDSTGTLGGVELLRQGLRAQAERRSSLIEVRFEYSEPEVPAAAVNAIIDAYLEIHGPDAETDFTRKRQTVSDLITQNRRRVEQMMEERITLLKDAPYGSSNLAGSMQSLVEKAREADSKLEALAAQIDKILEQTGKSLENPPPDSTQLVPTIVELDAIDPTLVQKRRELEAARVERSLLDQSYREGHPAYARVDRRIVALDRALEAARDGALNIWREGEGRSRSFGELRRQQDQLRKRIAGLREEVDRANALLARLGQLDRRIADANAEGGVLGERLAGLDREAESIRRGRVSVQQSGVQLPRPDSDKRLQLAAVGAGGGLGLSFAFFFMLGTVNPRAYRASQLANDTRGLRWLGVIPDMTEASRDPMMKELASNCIHRVRNKIEASRTPGDGYVIMVTSPFQGDGKTMVAGSLAYSYADSGHKTLIVDCDFIGRAMSHQFGHLHSPGVREVVRRGTVGDEIVSISDNLSILPVGVDANVSASNLQFNALRRLLRTLRDRYEIIIVDTGPVTASVEAIPIAASCDGALLTLRRGRSRARLPEAIRELETAGAEYLGVVLNYADRDDCMKYGSISKMSAEVARALTGGAAAATHPLIGAARADRGGAGGT